MSKYFYGVDFGKPDGDGTVYTVFRSPNWFEKHILRVKWKAKLVTCEYEPPTKPSLKSNTGEKGVGKE